jgi:hypothetical protein
MEWKFSPTGKLNLAFVEETTPLLEKLRMVIAIKVLPGLTKYCDERRTGKIPPPPGSELDPGGELTFSEDVLRFANNLLVQIMWIEAGKPVENATGNQQQAQ